MIVFTVSADPKPHHVAAIFYGYSSIVQANPDRPITSNFLEMQRGMAWIVAERFVAPIGEPLHVSR